MLFLTHTFHLPKTAVSLRPSIPPEMSGVLGCIPQKHTVRQEFVCKQYMKDVCPRETSKSRGSTTEKEKRPGKGVISDRVPERVTSAIPWGALKYKLCLQLSPNPRQKSQAFILPC